MAVNGYLMAQRYPQRLPQCKNCDECSDKWDGFTTNWMNKASFTKTRSEAIKNASPETLQPLVAKWRLVAYERTENGKKVWKEADPQYPSYLSFRFDGVVLDSKDLPYCCAPGALNINGKLFEIKPQANIPDNPMCALVDCIGCPIWNITLTGDEFILNLCGIGSVTKYTRIP